uniref:INCENP_ARK-bind domain-containing protein n=1 Tax=Strongyloides papillosus TaxID=174720 RepID=A0A0N5C350_STREA
MILSLHCHLKTLSGFKTLKKDSEKFQKLLEKNKTLENEPLSDNDIVNVKGKKSKQSSENHKSTLDKNNINTPIEELASENLNKNIEKNTSLSKKKVKTGKKTGQKKCETDEIIKETSLKNHINDKCTLNETSKSIVKNGNSQDEITEEFVISSNICDNETIMSTIKECISNETIIKNLSPIHKTNKDYGGGDISFVEKLSIESEIPSNDIENKEQIKQKISNISPTRIDQSSIKEKGISEESDTSYPKNDPKNLENQVSNLIQTLDKTKKSDIETSPLISPKRTKEKIPKTKAKSNKKQVNKIKDVENINVDLELTNDNNLIKDLEAVNITPLIRNMSDISYEELGDILIALEKSNDEYASELTILDSPKEIHTKNIKKDNIVPSIRRQKEKEKTTKTQKKHKEDKNKKAINLSYEIVDDVTESHQNETMKSLNNVDVDVSLIKNHSSEKEEGIFEDRITKEKVNQGSLKNVKPTIKNKQKDSLIRNKESIDDRKTAQEKINDIKMEEIGKKSIDDRKTAQEKINDIKIEEIPKDSNDSSDKKLSDIESKIVESKKIKSTRKVKKDSRNNDKKPLEDDYVDSNTCALNEVNVELNIDRCTSIDIETEEIILPSDVKDVKVHTPIKLTKAHSSNDKTDKQTILQGAKKETTKDIKKTVQKKKMESTLKSKDDNLANDNQEIDKKLDKKLQDKTPKKVQLETKVDISLTSNSKSDCASIVVNNESSNVSIVISVVDKKSDNVDNKSTTKQMSEQHPIINKDNIFDNKVISEAQPQETNNKNENTKVNEKLDKIKVSKIKKEKTNDKNENIELNNGLEKINVSEVKEEKTYNKNIELNNDLDKIKISEIKKEKTKNKKGKQSPSLSSNKDLDTTNENLLLDKEESSIDEINESNLDTKQLTSTNDEHLQEQTPNFVIKHQEYNLESGENIVIQQQLTAYPEPNILIKINDNILEQNENVKVIIEREKVEYSINVLVNEIDNTLNGTLSFIASNGLGIDKSFFSINVKDGDQKNKLRDKIEAPRINGPKIKSVKEGDNLKLIYTIKTIEIPEVRIYKNNVYVEDYRFTIDKKHNEYIVSFKIEKLSLSDSGEYVCKAINKKGEAMITTMVHVSKKEPYKNEQKIVTNEQVNEIVPKKRKNTPKALQIPREINSLYGEPSKKVSILSVTARIEADAETNDEAHITLSPREPLSASISIKGSVCSRQDNEKETQDYEKHKGKYTIEDLRNETDLVKEKIEVENIKSIKKPSHELKPDELEGDIKVSKKQSCLDEKVSHDSKELKDSVDTSKKVLDDEESTKEQKLKDETDEDYVRHPKKVSALKEKSIDRKSKDEIKKENLKDSVDLPKKVVEIKEKSVDEKNKDEFKKDKLKDALDKSKKVSEVKQKTTEEKSNDKVKKDKMKDAVDVSKKVSEVKEKLTKEKPNDDVKEDKLKDSIDASQMIHEIKEKPTAEKIKDEAKKKKIKDSIDFSKKVTEDKEKLTDKKPIYEIKEESVDLSKKLIEVKDETKLVKSKDEAKESSVDFHKEANKIKEKRKTEKPKDDVKNDSTDIFKEVIENKEKPSDGINKDVADISKKISEVKEKPKVEKCKEEIKKDSVKLPKKVTEAKEKSTKQKFEDDIKKDSVNLSKNVTEDEENLKEEKPKEEIKKDSIKLPKKKIGVKGKITEERSKDEAKKDSVDLSKNVTEDKEKPKEEKPKVEIKKDSVELPKEKIEVKEKIKVDKSKDETKKDSVELSKEVTKAKEKLTEEKLTDKVKKDSIELSEKIIKVNEELTVEKSDEEIKEDSADLSKKITKVKEKPIEKKSKGEIKKGTVDTSKEAPEVKEKPIEKKLKGEIKKDTVDTSKEALEVQIKPKTEKPNYGIKEDVDDFSRNVTEAKVKPAEEEDKDDIKKDSVELPRKTNEIKEKIKEEKSKDKSIKNKLKDTTDLSKNVTVIKDVSKEKLIDEVKEDSIGISEKTIKVNEKPKGEKSKDEVKSVDLPEKITEVKAKAIRMKLKDGVKSDQLEESVDLSKITNKVERKSTDETSKVEEDSVDLSKDVVDIKEKSEKEKHKEEAKIDSFDHLDKLAEVEEKSIVKKSKNESKKNKLKDSTDISTAITEAKEKTKDKINESFTDPSKKESETKVKVKSDVIEDKSEDSVDILGNLDVVKEKAASKKLKDEVKLDKLKDSADHSEMLIETKEKSMEKKSNDEIKKDKAKDSADLSMKTTEVKEKTADKKAKNELKKESVDLSKNINEFKLKKTDKNSKDEANGNSFGLSNEITEAKERLKGLIKKDPVDPPKTIIEVKENLADEKDKDAFKKDSVDVSKKVTEVKDKTADKKAKDEFKKDSFELSTKVIEVKEKVVEKKSKDEFMKDKLKDSSDISKVVIEVKEKPKDEVKEDSVDLSKKIAKDKGKLTEKKSTDENKKDSANLTKTLPEVEEKSTEKKSRGEDKKDSLDLSKKIIEVKKKSRSKSPKVEIKKEKLEDSVDPSKNIAIVKEQEAEKESNGKIINVSTDLSKEIPEVQEKPRNKKLKGEIKGDFVDLSENVNEVRLKKTDKKSKDETDSNSFGLSMEITEAKERLKGLVKKDSVDPSKTIIEVKENLTDKKNKDEFKKDSVDVSKKVTEVKEKIAVMKPKDEVMKDLVDVPEEITEVKEKIAVKKPKDKVKKEIVDHSKTIIEVKENIMDEKNKKEFKDDSVDVPEEITEVKEKIAVEKPKNEVKKEIVDHSKTIIEVKENFIDELDKNEFKEDSIDVSEEITEEKIVVKKPKDKVKKDIVDHSKTIIEVKEKFIDEVDKNEFKKDSTKVSEKVTKAKKKIAVKKPRDEDDKISIDLSNKITEVKEISTDQKITGEFNKDSIDVSEEITEVKEIISIKKSKDEVKKDLADHSETINEVKEKPTDEEVKDKLKEVSVEDSKESIDVKEKTIKKESKDKATKQVTDTSKRASKVTGKQSDEKPKNEIKKDVVDVSIEITEGKEKLTEKKNKDEIKIDSVELPKKKTEIKEDVTMEELEDGINKDSVAVSKMTTEVIQELIEEKCIDEIKKDFIDLSEKTSEDRGDSFGISTELTDSEEKRAEEESVEKAMKIKSKDSREPSKKNSKAKVKSSSAKEVVEIINDKEKIYENITAETKPTDPEDKKSSVYEDETKEEDSKDSAELSSTIVMASEINEVIKANDLEVKADYTKNQLKIAEEIEVDSKLEVEASKSIKIPSDSQYTNGPTYNDDKLIVGNGNIHSTDEVINATFKNKVSKDYEEADLMIKKRKPKRGLALKPSSQIHGRRGDTITLECELHHEDDEVSWKFNGSDISDCRMTIENMPYSSKLIIKDVLPSDSNSIVQYTTNDGEKNISHQSCLEIDEVPIEFIKCLDKKYIGEENNSIDLSVELNYVADNANWFVKKDKVAESEKYHLSVVNGEYKFHIENLDYDDSGLIEFVANDVLCCSTTLEIYGKPYLINKINNGKSITGNIDDKVTHVWNIKSNPVPECEIFFNDNKVETGIHFNIEVVDSKISLTKQNVSRKDSGEYKLRVFNKYGEDYDSFHILINDVPLPPTSLRLNSVDDDCVTISWSPPETNDDSVIFGYVIEIKETDRRAFKKVGQTNGNKTTFTIENLDINTEYLVRVAAKNKYGISEFTGPITVKTKSPFKAPTIITPPTIKNVINNSCELVWEECINNGGSEIYCYDVFGSENDKEWSKINSSPIFMCNYTVKGLKYSDDDNLVNYKFKVEATNAAGYTSNSDLASETITMNKKVSRPKKITNIPKITITNCDSVTVDWICCEPPEDYTWKSVKTPSPPVAISDLKEGISYVFKVCGENNEGEGECSETSEPVRMVTNEAPRFTRTLRNVSVAKKASLQLECHAIGEPLPLFVWCHNNNEIIPDESNNYQILVEGFTTILQVDKISEEHSGQYKCFAINEYGEDDTTCTLNVADVRAHFTSTFPEFTSVEEGTTIELTCELSDDDACVTWFKNGKKIDEFATAKYDIIVDGPIRKLRIKEATIFDSCDYSCVTSEGRRSFGEVEVHEKPPYIEIGPQDYTVKSLGETVRLSCTTSSPPKVVKWYKNGKEVWPQSGKIFMNKEDCLCYLDIYDFNEKDIGEYNVVIGDEGGDTSAPAHVKMLVQPEIQIKSYNGDTELHVGKDLYLQVEIQGVPKPKLSVTLNNEVIRSFGGRVEEYDNQAIIRLPNLERTHNGILKLIAENDVGVEEKGSMLNIVDIPSPPTNLRISDITSNEAKLTWENPKDDGGCQIEYLLIERKIADNARWRTLHKLKSFKEEHIVEDLYAGEVYAFRIVAVNDVGRSSPSNVVDCVTLEDDSEDIPLNETSVVDESLQPPNKPNVQSNGLIAEVSWDEVELADEYVVERRDEEDEIWIELCITDKCHYQDRSCTSTKKYFYRISSKSENKRSHASEATEFVFLLPAKVSEEDSLSNNQTSESIDIVNNKQEQSNKDTNNENETIDVELLEEESIVKSIKKKKVVKKEKIKKETKKMTTVDTEELNVFETETSIVVESGFNSKLISYLKSGTSTECKWYKNNQEETSDCYVTFDKESVYSIKNASEDDGGIYKCVWYDSSTTVEQTFNVTIKDSEIGLAKIIVPLSDKYVFEDEYETSLQLEISNISCNTIMKWYKDDVEIVMNTEKYSCEIENKIVKLSIKNTSISDKGNYMCKIFDGSSEIFSRCNLIVRERRSSDLVIDNTGVPMFHLHLKDAIIKVDDSIVLCVTNTTIPEPDDVEWYKDNDRIFPDNERYFVLKDKGRYILEILKAQISDSGVYKAIGFNKNGRCTSTCQVTVTETALTSPPEFTVSLMNEKVEEKNLVKFEVYLIGSQPLTVKWFKDNIPIIHSDRIRILDDERLRKYSLTILETLKSDAGNYKCIAFNGDGEAETDCILEIQEPRYIQRRVTNELAPTFIFPLPIIREVPELVEMSIVCIVTGEPEPSIKWFKDGELINKYHETIFNDGVASLIIRLPIVSDSGIYTCEATNSMGVAKCSGIINIKEVNHAAQVPPKFIEDLTNVSVIEGNEIILKCQLIGRPTPYVTWYKDGLKLLMNNRIIQYIDRHGNVKLNILEARLDDGGEYTCEAQNLDKKNNLKDFTHCTVNVNESDLTLLSASTALLNRDGRISRASSSIKLKSNQPPLILREPPPIIKLHEGNKELIEIEVDENNDAQIEWLFEGKPLIQSNTLKTYFDGRIAFLKFFQANKSQQGMYKFIASNAFGTTSTEIEVIVESMEFDHDYISEMPSFTKKLEDRVVRLHDKTTFECYVNGTPDINVKWLLNGKTINPSSNIIFNSYSKEDIYVHEVELNDISVEETGTLTCVAINKYGECYNSCEIILIKDESDHSINDESNH